MATIGENLIALQTVKNNIKTAIENKSVSMDGVPFTEYATKIGEIQGGGGSVTEPYIEETYNANGSLTSAVLHGHTNIRKYMFNDCDRLTSVILPNSLTTIKSYGFSSCVALPSITLPDSVNVIENKAFISCKALTSIAIPNGVPTIGYGTFTNCSSLASVSIPNSVHTIAMEAFMNCTSLTSIKLPDSLSTIEKYAFKGCTNIRSITIPSGVTSIGQGAFADTNIWHITMLGPAPVIQTDTFTGYNISEIIVPYSSLQEYSTATNWSDYSQRMSTRSEVVIGENGATLGGNVTDISLYRYVGSTTMSVGDVVWTWQVTLYSNEVTPGVEYEFPQTYPEPYPITFVENPDYSGG